MLDRLTIERMAAKAGDGPILVALSGGGDSVALLRLLSGAFPNLRAVIVDHKLRPGSGADAQRAAAIAASFGCAASIEELSWQEGASRAHEAARAARYRALCKAARACGARVIATGHTRDDQAETVMLRAERGSGLRGLAAIRAFGAAPLWPEGRGLWLARPLLNVRRHALREWLRQAGAVWIEDPANENAAYGRVRVRRSLAAMEQAGFDPMRLAALAERVAPMVAEIDAAAAALIEAAASFEGEEISVERAAWSGAAEVKRRALTALIIAAGGGARGPSPAQIAVLDGVLEEEGFEGFTLAGAWVRERRGSIVITRDRGGLTGRADGAPPLPPLPLAAGEETIWDRRVALMMPEPGWSVVVEAGAGVLARGEDRQPLAAALPDWLIHARVQHVLRQD